MSALTTLLKSEIPTYNTTLPVSGMKVSYRPFRVKEEKILLLAMEENTEEAMLVGIRNLIESCCDDVNKSGDLPIADLEYLFLNIRAKSVSETLTPVFTCPYTGEKIKTKIPVDKVKVTTPKKSNKINVTNKVGITMQYPTINILLECEIDDLENMTTEQSIDLITSCISEVWTEDTIYKKEETPKSDMLEFVESIPSESFKEIMDFFEDIPKLQHSVNYKTENNEKRTILLSGLGSFFD